MPVIIKDNQIYSGGSLNIALTQAEYDALVAQDKIDPTIFYYITDATSPVYSETVLWSGSLSPSGGDFSAITLYDDYRKYDAIAFLVNNSSYASSPVVVLTSLIALNQAYIQTGYTTLGVYFKFTAANSCSVANFSSSSPNTYTKIIGINYGDSHVHEIIGTLAAGTTSLTLQDALITTDSTIEVFTNVFGVNPTNIVTTNGQVVLSFDAQASDVGVKVRVT